MKGYRVLLEVLKEVDMVKRIPRRKDQSLRDYPLYTIPEAALYLAIPENTLRYWITSHPLWIVNHHVGKNVPFLSFHDIAQAYFIEVVRRYTPLTISDVRRILKAAQLESKAKYPLLKENIRVFQKHVLMDKQARGKRPRQVIDLSRHPQLAIPEVIQPLSTRIRWDSKGVVQVYPWRNWSGEATDQARPVTIDPEVMSGRLVISGTRIPVEVVALRKQSGETVKELARDYRLSEDAISKALTHLVPKAA
jgi:uncharacterized protein (DUF433 family)